LSRDLLPPAPSTGPERPCDARPVARGAADNPANRFETLTCIPDACVPGAEEEDARPPLRTTFYRDPARSLLSHNESPDVGFDTALNPYRGCEHGCIYCYARPSHEYLGFSAGLDFESRILVKEDAPELLRKALSSRRWTPRVVALGSVTDPYQPIERRLRLTRRCLEVFAEFRNPVVIVTKSALVTRDADLLAELARVNAACVEISITTLDDALRRAMEPRAPAPHRRLEAISGLASAGVPVGVMLAPIVPGLTDCEIPAIVEAAARAGARSIRHTLLRLPHGVADLFEGWLERHCPERKQRVLNRIRHIRGGRLDDPRFHSRMSGSGIFAEQIHAMFDLARRRAGLLGTAIPLSAGGFRPPPGSQLPLF
jgi:DNA repair photolyase